MDRFIVWAMVVILFFGPVILGREPGAVAAVPEMLDGDPGGEGRAAGPDIAYINTYSLTTTLYPGDVTSFYMRIYSQYAGDLFIGTHGRPSNASALNNVHVTIDGISNELKNPITDIPLIWNVSTVNDNGGSGWNILSSGSYATLYADDMSNRDRFTVKTTGVQPGRYFIRIKEVAHVMTDYDGTSYYTYMSYTDNDYIAFEVRSFLGPYTNLNYTITALTETDSTEVLYSGAANERIGIQGITAISGTVTEIHGKLAIPSTRFSIRDANVFSARTGSTIFWRIDVDSGTPPGYYNAFVQWSYVRNDVAITEKETAQSILVQHTPLLGFPDTQDMTTASAALVQNTPRANISVTLRNAGNVDLRDVTVCLDLDNAAYFHDGTGYWNEKAYAGLTSAPQPVDIGDMVVGESKTALFDDLTIQNNLPPGLYLIPVDYSAMYRSNGSLKPTGDYLSGGWDEKGYNDYGAIMRAIASPEPASAPAPFIVVKVLEDSIGLDISSEIQGVYYAGSRNAYFQMQVENLEKYSFEDVTYSIRTDQNSPLKNLGASDNDPATALPAITHSTLGASSTDYVYFYADVKSTAGAGVRHISVDFSGSNAFGVRSSRTLDAPIVLGALPADIRMVRLSAELTPGKTGIVTVTVQNVGRGGAGVVAAVFQPTGTILKALDEKITVGNLSPGAEATFKFGVGPVVAGSSLSGTHYGYLYYEYIDDSQVRQPLYSGGSDYVSFTLALVRPDLVVSILDCPPVKAGQTFEATVKVLNIGGSTAENASVMLVNTHPEFSLADTDSDIGDIAPGQSASVTFVLKAGADIAEGTTYNFDLRFSYRQIDGERVGYSAGDRETFTVRTKDLVDVSRQDQTVEYKGTPATFDIGSLLSGIFMLVGLAILALALRRQQRQAPPQAAPMPPPAPLQVAPDYMLSQNAPAQPRMWENQQSRPPV